MNALLNTYFYAYLTHWCLGVLTQWGLVTHLCELFHPWWRHQMETFSALLALCAGNSPVPGEFPAQRPVTRSFDVIFDLRPNKRLSIQSWGWWFETLSCSLWRHCNDWFWYWSATDWALSHYLTQIRTIGSKDKHLLDIVLEVGRKMSASFSGHKILTHFIPKRWLLGICFSANVWPALAT